jgi:hypothetical protein
MPTDHEHLLCKVMRVKKLLREVKDEGKILEWSRMWLQAEDLVGIDLEIVRSGIKIVTGLSSSLKTRLSSYSLSKSWMKFHLKLPKRYHMGFFHL